MAGHGFMEGDVTATVRGQAGQLELIVLMPLVSCSLSETMHALIGAVGAFPDRRVVGLGGNWERAEGLPDYP